ncbi:MAG TPA: twin-arginine translocase subunit TatC [Chthonomonadaceae bacterium]|nr:twin-arginine translocase subunit TatC [Chthonomonadaceae bacterium]
MAEHHDDKRMELSAHLQELRARIIRSLLYLVVGSILAYFFFTPIYGFLTRPLVTTITKLNLERTKKQANAQLRPGTDTEPGLVMPAPIKPGETVTAEKYNELLHAVDWIRRHPLSVPMMGQVFRNFPEAFLVQLEVSILIGFIVSVPLIIWELALFVTPALTPEERKPLRVLIPISVVLVLFGVTVAYLTLFFAMSWFLSFLDAFSQDAALLQDPHDYVLFFIKMMAAFAIAFQLPVVLMGGGYLGLVSSKGLSKNWRWGIVIAALGGLLTPSNDIPSMMLMAIPLMILYFGSILLVRMVERWKAADQARSKR